MSDPQRPAVLAVMKLPPFFLEPLRAHFTVHDRLHETNPEEFARVAPTIRAVTGGGDSQVPRALMDKLPALEMVSIMGVGYDKVDVPAAKERGIPVTHTPDVLNDEVADLALALMLSIARKVPQADRYVREGRWEQGNMPLATRMSGKRLGIVGLGRIGKAIAARAQGFGMSIAYTGRTQQSGVAFPYHPSAKALAAAVDFLVVITPGGEATRRMINAEVLQALGPKGYLVNVARGSVVDEQALIEALQDGVIAGAGLDVFENEPQVPAALRALDNVVLTPHMASATHETRQAMADLALANLQAHFAGKPLLSPVPECR
ncbi:2-hydroxyacid dehydrogenase [Ramlibacter sp. USB13]|uniref:2-hydroxyacid dehydrogenase n=1 Tax=Ramlibacter cellulosilyticus TaxID=2764187 RepID=A0A923MRU9_9BURK|nr:2-hydroxyacid dehydrogenase [Ramlibacter cellulosilyticus]MBC5784325.1 2-hydroxyacid dehydrogenase [Ramlibacter cellulosilyticus]